MSLWLTRNPGLEKSGRGSECYDALVTSMPKPRLRPLGEGFGGSLFVYRGADLDSGHTYPFQVQPLNIAS